MPAKPTKLDLYLYNVYFGDCFLLIFRYADGSQKSVLIDFGSTGKGHSADAHATESTGKRLLAVANDIADRTNGKLDVVVATHRHKDHIYGFGLKEAGKVILDLDPEIVIQPWTEDPADNRNLSKVRGLMAAAEFQKDVHKNFISMLYDMHGVAESIDSEAQHLGSDRYASPAAKGLVEKIVFMADDNKDVGKIKNLKAVQNLQKMRGPHYVSFGYNKIDWSKILPGIKVQILGPPLVEDHPKMRTATNTSDEFWSLFESDPEARKTLPEGNSEYWSLLAMSKYMWGVLAATNSVPPGNSGARPPIFDAKHVLKGQRPANVRWFIRRLRDVRANQLLLLVKFVDRALNNTSVIMSFEVGDQKLLFPGDAQIENWEFLLAAAKRDPKLKKLLQATTMYKVGHHASRNATPLSLWNDFKNRTPSKTKKNRLRTVVSTMKGKHGETEDTEVPLPRMVTAMKAETHFHSTEEFGDGIFVQTIEIPIK